MDIEEGKKYRHIPTGIVVTVKYVDGDEVHFDDGCWATKDTLTYVSNFEKFFEKVDDDRVNHPSYYQDPSGVECITVARYRDFNIGNALKYLWRAGIKTEEGISDIDKQIEDLKKAVFYINDEINKLNNNK